MPGFFQPGAFLCVLCILLWCLCIYKELRSIFLSFEAVSQIPRTSRTILVDQQDFAGLSFGRYKVLKLIYGLRTDTRPKLKPVCPLFCGWTLQLCFPTQRYVKLFFGNSFILLVFIRWPSLYLHKDEIRSRSSPNSFFVALYVIKHEINLKVGMWKLKAKAPNIICKQKKHVLWTWSNKWVSGYLTHMIHVMYYLHLVTSMVNW